jgi:hypothetical protein
MTIARPFGFRPRQYFELDVAGEKKAPEPGQ